MKFDLRKNVKLKRTAKLNPPAVARLNPPTVAMAAFAVYMFVPVYTVSAAEQFTFNAHFDVRDLHETTAKVAYTCRVCKQTTCNGGVVFAQETQDFPLNGATSFNQNVSVSINVEHPKEIKSWWCSLQVSDIPNHPNGGYCIADAPLDSSANPVISHNVPARAVLKGTFVQQ